MLIVYYLFVVFAWFISLMPFRILYIISDCFYLIIYIVGYRKKVIYKNIHNAFPEKTDKEVRTIMKKFYHHLCDVFFEVLKLTRMSTEEKQARVEYKNIEVLHDLHKSNKNVICVIGHYGNWEWNGPHILGKITNYKILAVVKRLTDKRFEKFLTNIRGKEGGIFIPITQTLRVMVKHHNEMILTIMAADQSPMKTEIEYWTKFLNQETAVFLGPEKIAKKLDHAVVFLKLSKPQRGFYKVEIIKISDNAKATKDFYITEEHVKILEQAIIEQPELWMWSHKRWKFKKDEVKTLLTEKYQQLNNN